MPQALVLTAILASSSAQASADTDAAVAVVRRLQAALVETAAVNPPLDLESRTQLLEPVVTEAHDLATMGRLTVRRYWRDWSEAEQQAFLDVFERLSVATYASRFASVGPDSFEIVGSEPIDDDEVEVESFIRRKDGDDVTMDYTLRFDGERWRIINVLADGASELGVMVAEYHEILDGGSVEDLEAYLEAKIAAL